MVSAERSDCDVQITETKFTNCPKSSAVSTGVLMIEAVLRYKSYVYAVADFSADLLVANNSFGQQFDVSLTI